ncbi:MAG TPA: hypothetical protein PLV72_00490 [Candidatus Magasanikbacteria bacterium]|nr:hypothetical protein [Candidatus Magasanikbacteria bacterium]
MRTPIYRKAMKDSLSLAWNNKHLWILGLFAAALGQMGLVDILSGVGYAGEGRIMLLNWLSWPEALWNFFANLQIGFGQWVWLVLVILIFVFLFVAFVFASVTSQGGIIAASIRHAYGKYTDATAAWHYSQNHFWRLFSINLVKKVLILVLTTVIGICSYMVIFNPHGFDLAVFLVFFVLATLIGSVISFLAIYASAYVVAENHGFLRSIHEAWKLFLDHWLVSVEMGVLVLLSNIIFLIVLCVGIMAVIIPTFLLWFVTIVLAGNIYWFFGVVFGSVCAMAVAFAMIAMFQIFTTSVWCNLFVKMHNEGVVSKVARLVGIKKV